jgi:hypothetical protein
MGTRHLVHEPVGDRCIICGEKIYETNPWKKSYWGEFLYKIKHITEAEAFDVESGFGFVPAAKYDKYFSFNAESGELGCNGYFRYFVEESK